MSRRGRRRPPPERGWPIKLGLGLTVAFVVLIGAELAARGAGVTRAYAPDRIGGWSMQPEADAKVIRTREGHMFELSTNADGMRTTLPRTRTPGVARVAVLGDSIAFGWGAPDDQTLSTAMQERLRERGHEQVEVLNAAQPGYSTSQVNRYFDHIVRHYQPDYAIVFLPMHDHNLVVVSDREHLRGADGITAAIRVGLAKHSALFEWLRQALFPLADQAFVVATPDSPKPSEPRVPRVSEDERAQNLDELQAWLAEWDGTLALGHMPFVGDMTSPTPMDRLGADWAEAYASDRGLDILDLRRCCGPDGADLVFPFDPGHLTGPGNQQAGRYAADALLEVWTPPDATR